MIKGFLSVLLLWLFIGGTNLQSSMVGAEYNVSSVVGDCSRQDLGPYSVTDGIDGDLIGGNWIVDLNASNSTLTIIQQNGVNAGISAFDICVGGGDFVKFTGISEISNTFTHPVSASAGTENSLDGNITIYSTTGMSNDGKAVYLLTSIGTSDPTLSSLSPADGNTSASLTNDLSATFNENITLSSGDIVIYNSSDVAVETFNVATGSGNNGGSVSVSGDTLTINPGSDLSSNTGYYVQIAATAIDDSAGNSFLGITDTTTWNFTTIANQSPTISGTISNQAINDNAGAMTPFNSVVLADGDDDNISVTLSLDTSAKGTLSDTNISSGTIASVQSALRAITFTPTNNRLVGGDTETTTITITVNDGTSDTNNTGTTIITTGINDTPSIISSAITSIDEDRVYSYTLSGSDVDGDDLNWSVKSGTTLPSWLSLSASDTNISVTTLAGNDSSGSSDGKGTSAFFNRPNGITIGFEGRIFVTDMYNNLIREVSSNGLVTTFAGNGDATSIDGVGTEASFYRPQGMLFYDDALYVTDSNNHKIRKITSDGNVTTFVGTGSANSTDGNLTTATFDFPSDIVKDSNNNFFIADKDNNLIRKIAPDGTVSTFAGTGSAGSVNGNGTSASFNAPYGLAIDSNDNLFIADSGNHLIRKITPDGNVTTFAGSGDANSTDGNGTSASFNWLDKLYIDENDNIFVGDTSNNKIRKVTSEGVVTTLAGEGTAGSTDGNETTATFNGPTDIIFVNNYLYITDTFGHKIRKIERPMVLSGTPTNDDVGDHNITIVVSDGNTSVEQSFTITVNNVNDAPTASNISFIINEDNNKTFISSDFNGTDIDVNDSVSSIFITTLEISGALQLSGNDVTLNQEINISDISNLKFVPTTNENGIPYTTFGFKVSDGESNSSEYTATINVNSIADTPVITSNGSGASAVINVVENNTSVTTVVASDADSGDTKTYSISGGADSSKFDINSSTGVLTFKTAPNYESPTDSGSDNTYEVIVQVADSNNSTDSQTLNVTVTNDTTEAPTVSLSVNNSTVAENSGTSTITATLSEAVSAVTTVTIGLKSGSTTDLNSDFNLSSTTITINANSTTGTAIFTSLDDLIDDNSEIATIEINSVSGGESASENGTQEVNITITDDDTAGVTLNKTTASVDENGTTSTFTIILDTKPTGNVIIDLNSSDTSEATLSVSSLTFTTSDWNTTKTVTITGVDDNIVDGDINSTITASINTGSTVDSVYDAISNKTLTVTTRDDDSAGFSLSKTTASVSENNTTDTFTVVLDKAPTSNVELNITISDQSEATVSPSSLTFSDSNWNIAQTVTITGVDDNLTDGSVESNITVSVIDANSNDSFDPLANQTVTVTTTDNDNNLPVITQGTPQAKTINEDNNLSFDLNATDDDNDTLTWSIETDATNGSASTSGNGNSKTITYSPNSNYNGNDTFKVKVTDSKGGTDTIDINVTITPINDTPSFDFNLSDITLLEDNGTTPYDINISDIDGDDLNLTIESNNTNIITVSKGWTNSIAQGNYNVAQDFNLSTVSNANGLVRITLSLTDGNLSTSQTFDVNVSAVNDIPVINTNFSNVSMDEDNGTTNYDLNISDIDLSDLNLTIESNNTSLITVSTNYINDINSSTYSNLLDFNLSTVADANGIAKITLTLSDGELNATSSFDVNIGAVNDVPVIETNLSNLSKNEDSASSFIDLNTTDVDSNASTVTYSVDSNNSSIASARVVNGVLIVSPKENANGIVSIEVNATVDGQTVTKTFTYTLNSVNDRPKIDHLENIFHDQSSSIISNTISFGISDDTNVTSLSVTTVNTTLIPDANISVRKDSDTSASLTYAIAANETGKSKITVTASDGNLSYSESFTVRVNASNDSLCVDNTKTELSFDTIKNGNVAQNYIINDLNLVSTINTICSSTITWSSSDTNVIENNGSVTVGSTDSTVAVTATIVKGENNATKQFLLTVPAGTVSDSTAVSNITFQDIKNTNNRQDNIVADLTLLSSSLGKDINWSSTNEAVIDPYTFVVSRTGSDENVVLTATIGSSTKDFNLTVIATPTSTSDKLAKDMSWLNFERILDKNRDNNNVIYNLIKPLPSSGPNDSTITWTTSDSAVITTDGDVIRDTTSDKYITMTASFDNSGTTNTKEFLLRVLKNETTTSDANVTFKQVVDNNNTVAVSFSEDGSDTNTTASFDSSLVSSLEKIISDDSIQSVLELTDKIINLFLNTDGTAQSQAEFTNDDNESVISSVKIDATKSSTSVDSNGTVLSTVSIDANTTVKGQLNSDGSVSHSVDINSSDSNKTTSASATIPGSKVEADSAGNVETTSEIKSGNTIYKAVATSDKNGNTKTKFITINLTTGEETDVDNTLDDTTPYAPGNTVEISEINGTVYIKTTAPLDGNLNVK